MRDPESAPSVFISCGQYTEAEKRLGRALASIVSSRTQATGYFAENQSSLAGVTEHILRALDNASGFVAVMHRRGAVRFTEDGQPFYRASVWVEQEIAIAAYLVQVVGRDIPVQLYVQHGIEVEGLRDNVLLHATSFEDDREVEEHFEGHVSRIFPVQTLRPIESEPNLASPLGDKGYPLVNLIPAGTNPDFTFGMQIWPKSYALKARYFDADDEDLIRAAEAFSRGTTGSLHTTLSLRTITDGVILSTPATGEKRPDGAIRQPDQQIQIDSDGDMTIRFVQDDNNPYWQLLALLGTAYLLTTRIYPSLGLEAAIRYRIEIRLHAGRERQQPVLPGYATFSDEASLDSKTFVDAFTDAVLSVLRSGGVSFARGEIQDTLRRFSQSELTPYTPT